MAAKLAKQITIVTPDKVGMLAEVTGAIAGAEVNIEAICAYGMEDKAYFMVITNDNAKAIGAIKQFDVKEDDVVVVELENKVGTTAQMGKKLKDAGIDLKYLYGTTCGSGTARSVFDSNDNAKAVEVLK